MVKGLVICHTELNAPGLGKQRGEIRQRVILKTSIKGTKNAQPRLGLTGLTPEPSPGDDVSKRVPSVTGPFT